MESLIVFLHIYYLIPGDLGPPEKMFLSTESLLCFMDIEIFIPHDMIIASGTLLRKVSSLALPRPFPSLGQTKLFHGPLPTHILSSHEKKLFVGVVNKMGVVKQRVCSVITWPKMATSLAWLKRIIMRWFIQFVLCAEQMESNHFVDYHLMQKERVPIKLIDKKEKPPQRKVCQTSILMHHPYRANQEPWRGYANISLLSTQ